MGRFALRSLSQAVWPPNNGSWLRLLPSSRHDVYTTLQDKTKFRAQGSLQCRLCPICVKMAWMVPLEMHKWSAGPPDGALKMERWEASSVAQGITRHTLPIWSALLSESMHLMLRLSSGDISFANLNGSEPLRQQRSDAVSKEPLTDRPRQRKSLSPSIPAGRETS